MSEQLKQELEADTDRLETGTVAGSETIGEQEEKPTEGKLEAQEGDESKEEDTVPMGKASLADIVSGIPAPTKAINRYRGFPQLEWFIKMGLYKLAAHLINEYHDGAFGYESRNGVRGLRRNGKTIFGILGLTKENTRVLQSSFTGSRNPDCKYTGNNSYAPVSVLWDIESIHTVTNSTDTERSSPDIWRNNRRSDYFIGSRASCIRLRQRFE